MTVSATSLVPDLYTYSSLVTDYAVTFPFDGSTDIVVTGVWSNGTRTEYTSGIDYTVVGTDVVIAAAPSPVPEQIEITRRTAQTQGLALANLRDFDADDMEDALDRAILLLQEVAEKAGRSIRVSVPSGLTGDDLLVPVSAGRALGWNADGDGLTTYPATTIYDRPGGQVFLSDYTDVGTGRIAAAVADIGASEAELVVDMDDVVAFDTTIPATMVIRFINGNVLTVNNGVTLSVYGFVNAGKHQIFNCISTGIVSFKSGSNNLIFDRWFGTVGDGVSDDYAALSNLFASLYDGAEAVITGLCFISSGLTLGENNIKLRGHGSGYFTPGFVADSDIDILSCSGYGALISGLIFCGDGLSLGVDATTGGIVFARSDLSKDIDSEVDNCTFYALEYGIKATGANLVVKNSLFSISIYGIKIYRMVAEECRGFDLTSNRFHSLGGADADLSVADSTCIYIDYSGAIRNKINDNLSDGCKIFFKGPASHSSICNNIIADSRNTAIEVTLSYEGHIISGNSIEDGYGAQPTGTEVDGYGIFLTSANNGVVSNNTVIKKRRHGIFLVGSDSNSILGNTILNANFYNATDGAIYDGIHIDATSNYNNISGNVVNATGVYYDYALNLLGNENVLGMNWLDAGASGAISDAASATRGLVMDGRTGTRRIAYGAAEPAAGSWQQGDVVLHIDAASGEQVGWICVSAGTPGTWRPVLMGGPTTGKGADGVGTNVFSANANALGANVGFMQLRTATGLSVYVPYWTNITP